MSQQQKGRETVQWHLDLIVAFKPEFILQKGG